MTYSMCHTDEFDWLFCKQMRVGSQLLHIVVIISAQKKGRTIGNWNCAFEQSEISNLSLRDPITRHLLHLNSITCQCLLHASDTKSISIQNVVVFIKRLPHIFSRNNWMLTQNVYLRKVSTSNKIQPLTFRWKSYFDVMNTKIGIMC